MNKNLSQNVVGVDTHKETLACYCNGKFKEFKTNVNGFKQAVKWAGKATWAIEGAYCFGQPFTAYLIKNGLQVFEVNPLLTKTWRGVIATTNPKNDYGDAKVISLFAKPENLQKVSLDLLKEKELLQQRDFAVKEKVRITNNLKMLFFTRGEQCPFNDLTSVKAINWLIEQDDFILRQQGKLLKQLIENIKEYEKEIKKNIPQKAEKLMQIKGISEIRATQIVVETKGQVTTESRLANYAGIAPVESSSGKTKRFKTNKKGNRKLNSIFFALSIAQIRYNPEARKYYEKKIAEGKTSRHARKCVARQLVRIIFNLLKD